MVKINNYALYNLKVEPSSMNKNMTLVNKQVVIKLVTHIFFILVSIFASHQAFAEENLSDLEINKLITLTEEIRRTDYAQFNQNIDTLTSIEDKLNKRQYERVQYFKAYQYTLQGYTDASLAIHHDQINSEYIDIRIRSYISLVTIYTQLKKFSQTIDIIDKLLVDINSKKSTITLKNEGLQVIGFFYNSISEYNLAQSYFDLIAREDLALKELCLLDYLQITNKLSAGTITGDDKSINQLITFCYNISDFMMANGLLLAKAIYLTKNDRFQESIDLLNKYQSQIDDGNFHLHILSFNLTMMENNLSLDNFDNAEFFAEKISETPHQPNVKLKYHQLLARLKYAQGDFKKALEHLQTVNKEQVLTRQEFKSDQIAKAQVKHQIVEKNKRLNTLIVQSQQAHDSVNDLTDENKQLLSMLNLDKIIIVLLIALIILFYFALFFLRAHKQGLKNNRDMDPLTGVFMRRKFTDLFASMVYKAKFSNQPLAVISFNFDKLKRINNIFSIDDGDYVLQQTIRFTHEIISSEDVIARIGSDEFAIAMPNKTMHQAEVTAHRIANNLNLLRCPRTGEPYKAKASFGICDTQFSNYVPKTLLADSSKALMKAKSSDSKVILYSPDMSLRKPPSKAIYKT